jgi:Domain of unknown function (DUF1833).
MREAYASPAADEVIIHTLELDHATLDQPIRIACNVADDIGLPLERDGAIVHFVAMGVKVTPPSFDDDGPGSAQVQIDNVSGMLAPIVQAAVQSGSAFAVTYRAYTSADLLGPGETYSGLLLKRVSLTATMASGTLEMAEMETQAFPRLTYSIADYPALHGQS